MEQDKLYLLNVKINIGTEEGIDLPGKLNKLNTLLEDYRLDTGCLAKCIHKYKVTGEPGVLAVFSVSNVVGLERILSTIARLGHIDVDCTPLIPYIKFADRLGVEGDLVQPSPNCVEQETELTWLEVFVGYTGKSQEELLRIWKEEAIAALGARAGGAKMELFKVVASRVVHGFFGASAHDGNNLDNFSFTLPIMAQNGENVRIKSKGLIDLNHYCNTISA